MFLKFFKTCIKAAIDQSKWERTARQLGTETVELNKALKAEREKVVLLELAGGERLNHNFKSKPVRQFAEMMDRAAGELDAAAWDVSAEDSLKDIGAAVEELDDAVFRDKPPLVIRERAVTIAITAMMIAHGWK